ncbi:MAG: hypothetical protein KC933_25225 [Myxococcales bacterium]|nr:hypothetical protein [Myxococcales bacterium]
MTARRFRPILTASMIVISLGQSACGLASSEVLEAPYVEEGSAEDVWDYTSAQVDLKVRLVEYPEGIADPEGGGLVYETLEVLTTEGVIIHAYDQVGVAVGDRVLRPASPPPRAQWRSVDYAPSAIPTGAQIRCGYFGGGGIETPTLDQASQIDTGLVYDPAKILRYKR